MNIYMTAFNESGVLVYNGKGEEKEVIYKNGEIVRQENFKNGLLDGWRIDYYANGSIKTKSFYKNGKLDGIQFSYYDSGKIQKKESFKDGKHEGFKVDYYQNGQIKQSSFQKSDSLEGAEHAYYENGRLKFKGYWINNKFYGSQYIYYENGKVKIYHAYDIVGEKFYLSHYDDSGKLTQSDGYVLSSNIYSKTLGNDSAIILKDNGIYKNIQDLYLNVANPPLANAGIKVIINNKKFKKIDLTDDNTVKIVNAFPNKGKYKIVLEGGFLDNSNIIIDDSDVIGTFIIIKR